MHFYFLKKSLNFEVCKFEKKYFRFECFIFANTINYNTETSRSCANLKVVVFFLSEISSRGASVQKYYTAFACEKISDLTGCSEN